MARKRNTGPESALSPGAAPARERRKHASVTPTAIATPSELSLPASAAPAPAATTPGADDIARLAYSYWEARGFQGGSPEEDWLRAEQELRGGSLSSRAQA
jgi:hypothetical protein